jgi:hypothetical protein
MSRTGWIREQPDLVLRLNGREVYRGHDDGLRTDGYFPSGAPIVSAHIFLHKQEIEHGPRSFVQFIPIEIPLSSGISNDQLATAAKCLFDHRDQVENTVTQLGITLDPIVRQFNDTLPERVTVKLGWMMLFDDSIKRPNFEGVSDLPPHGGFQGQLFTCQNNYPLETRGEYLETTNPPHGRFSGRILGIISPQGKLLFNPSSPYWSAAFSEMTDVDRSTIPTSFATCYNSKGVSLDAFLKTLSEKMTYYYQ